MLAAVGDLLEDIVVAGVIPATVAERRALGGDDRTIELRFAADTDSVIERRRGGSAANVVVAAADLDHPARFIGRVGDDGAGRGLVEQLRSAGVDPVIQTGGRTGAVVVLCHADGERSMLTDRGASVGLVDPDSAWLDGVSFLHVPLYSLVVEPLAGTATTLIEWAHRDSIPVSIDVSATSVIEAIGGEGVGALLATLVPTVVVANADEASLLAEAGPLAKFASTALVEKRGRAPARIHRSAKKVVEVPAVGLGEVSDTTGAGDAFAAGLLVALTEGDGIVDSVARAHRVAAAHVRAIQRT